MSAPGDTGPHGGRSSLLPLTLTALGVVYGDIGTSPLYAIREAFFGSHAVPPSHENVLGVLSFVLSALLLIISIKYIVVVMRADNQGEGGILALTALLPPRNGAKEGTRGVALGRPILIGLGIFGAALLYGEGMIIVTRRPGMAVWRERLFVLMARNAVRATAFFRLPPERVVELGVQVEM